MLQESVSGGTEGDGGWGGEQIWGPEGRPCRDVGFSLLGFSFCFVLLLRLVNRQSLVLGVGAAESKARRRRSLDGGRLLGPGRW